MRRNGKFLSFALLGCIVLLLTAGVADAAPLIEVVGGEGQLAVDYPGTVGVAFEDYTLVADSGNGTVMRVDSDSRVFTIPSDSQADNPNPGYSVATLGGKKAGLNSPPVGVLVSAYYGSETDPANKVMVYFADFTSTQQHCDIGGPANGRPANLCRPSDRIVFTFVSPYLHSDSSDPCEPLNYYAKATVAGFGCRWGDITAGTGDREIRFYDVNGVEIAATDNIIPYYTSGLIHQSNRAYIAKENGEPVSVVHKVVMVYKNPEINDLWTIGCYNDNPAKNDFSFYDLQVAADINVTAPVGGEVFKAGDTTTITWDSGYDAAMDPNYTSTGVDIAFSTDNGSTWTPVYPPNVGNTGSYTWQVPNGVISTQCLVKVSDTIEPLLNGVNPASFTVYECTVSDMSGDCVINLDDLMLLISQWLDCGDPVNPACGG